MLAERPSCELDGENVRTSFVLLPAERDNGFATETVGALVKYFFGSLGRCQLVALPGPNDAPAVSLTRNPGFVDDGPMTSEDRYSTLVCIGEMTRAR